MSTNQKFGICQEIVEFEFAAHHTVLLRQSQVRMNGNESGYETAGNGGGEPAVDGREDPDILAEVRTRFQIPFRMTGKFV